uniref:Uncharacterized protein n=1 Tax=Setaria italica TaxID=4555 RepID=K3Z1X3_SETIT
MGSPVAARRGLAGWVPLGCTAAARKTVRLDPPMLGLWSWEFPGVWILIPRYSDTN